MFPSDSRATLGKENLAWKERAVERSLRNAKQRAAERGQLILDAAQSIITENGSTEFTVQDVVDRSQQSLRTFYLQFDGKHDLLLALYEDALRRTAEQLRAAAEAQADPLDKLRVVVELLFELCKPDPAAQRPLFTEFAPRQLAAHPAHVRLAHAPVRWLFTELMEHANITGRIQAISDSRRIATVLIQTVMLTAQGVGAGEEHPISAHELWEFCAHGFFHD